MARICSAPSVVRMAGAGAAAAAVLGADCGTRSGRPPREMQLGQRLGRQRSVKQNTEKAAKCQNNTIQRDGSKDLE